METKQILSTEEAAKIIGITRQGVSYLIKAGKLKPVDYIKSKHHFLTEEEIYQYKGRK